MSKIEYIQALIDKGLAIMADVESDKSGGDDVAHECETCEHWLLELHEYPCDNCEPVVLSSWEPKSDKPTVECYKRIGIDDGHAGVMLWRIEGNTAKHVYSDGKSDVNSADIEGLRNALNAVESPWQQITEAEFDVIAACLMTPKEPERNADGDTIDDMKAVQDVLGKGSIGFNIYRETWSELKQLREFSLSVAEYRITAKHADVFDAKCMDFETWVRAAIDRGMVVRVIDAATSSYYTGFRSDGFLVDKDGYYWGLWEHRDLPWIAITHARCKEETNPKEPVEPPSPARHVTTREHGANLVLDRKDGERAVATCPTGQDAQRVARALNEMGAREAK